MTENSKLAKSFSALKREAEETDFVAQLKNHLVSVVKPAHPLFDHFSSFYRYYLAFAFAVLILTFSLPLTILFVCSSIIVLSPLLDSCHVTKITTLFLCYWIYLTDPIFQATNSFLMILFLPIAYGQFVHRMERKIWFGRMADFLIIILFVLASSRFVALVGRYPSNSAPMIAFWAILFISNFKVVAYCGKELLDAALPKGFPENFKWLFHIFVRFSTFYIYLANFLFSDVFWPALCICTAVLCMEECIYPTEHPFWIMRMLLRFVSSLTRIKILRAPHWLHLLTFRMDHITLKQLPETTLYNPPYHSLSILLRQCHDKDAQERQFAITQMLMYIQHLSNAQYFVHNCQALENMIPLLHSALNKELDLENAKVVHLALIVLSSLISSVPNCANHLAFESPLMPQVLDKLCILFTQDIDPNQGHTKLQFEAARLISILTKNLSLSRTLIQQHHIQAIIDTMYMRLRGKFKVDLAELLTFSLKNITEHGASLLTGNSTLIQALAEIMYNLLRLQLITKSEHVCANVIHAIGMLATIPSFFQVYPGSPSAIIPIVSENLLYSKEHMEQCANVFAHCILTLRLFVQHDPTNMSRHLVAEHIVLGLQEMINNPSLIPGTIANRDAVITQIKLALPVFLGNQQEEGVSENTVPIHSSSLPPPKRYTTRIFDEYKMSEESCSVCLDDYKHDGKIAALKNCQHLFHQQCIDLWLMKHSTCPCCRTQV